MSRRCAIALGVLSFTFFVAVAQADVFNMPNGQVSLRTVPVGNAGNAADTTGCGAVGYNYSIGKYDVTVGQYCEFLNAVAKTDSYYLYTSGMAMGYVSPTVGIARSGSWGNYSYSVAYDAAAWSTYSNNYPNLYSSPLAAASACPIFDTNWGDAARFCNWLQNGQPSFAAGTPGEVAGSTETGAYTLNGDMSYLLEPRNTGATWFLPSENEWYKAAYYNPSTGAYWTYPTQSDPFHFPSNVLSATGTNNANFSDNGYTDPMNHLTPVGVFAASPGPYGTYDMGGDVWQWNEAITSSLGFTYRGQRGGFWNMGYNLLASYTRGGDSPVSDFAGTGFRVASLAVPEPDSVALLVAVALGLPAYTWRRRLL